MSTVESELTNVSESIFDKYRVMSPSQRAQACEFAIEQLIMNWCRPNDVAIDAGANFGAHTVTMCRAVGTNGHVLAFEPDPRAASRIQTFRSKLPQLDVYNFALSDSIGEADFFLSVKSEYSSLFNRERLGFELSESVRVETTTVDDHFANSRLSSLRFMKIDVEGAECAVLRGSRKTISKYQPIIALNIHWSIAEKAFGGVAGLFAYLGSLGPRGYEMLDVGGRRLSKRDSPEYIFFLVPKGSSESDQVGAITSRAVQKFVDSDRTWNLYSKFS